MSYVNGVIAAPVSIYDAQRAVGSGSPDLATLCMNNNINMWSVGKPVYFPKVGELTDADLKTGRSVNGYSISYGIKKRASDTWSDYIDASTGEVLSAVWQYDKPVLDGVNVFRLTDFNHYWTTAQCAMVIALDSKTRVVVPSTQGGTGDVLHYTLNFRYMLYASGAISSQQLFGACANYHPSMILTCLSDSYIWQYVKSSNLTIGEIGADSQQSGADVYIDMADVAEAMVHDGATYGTKCLQNGRQWTACMVLLSGDPVPGSTVQHTVAGRTIVRMEYEAGIDRNTFLLSSGKYSYVSAMSMTVTLKKNSNGSYYIDSITVTATKLTNDAMTFNVHAQFACVIGTVVISGVSGSTVDFNPINFAAQTGSTSASIQLSTVTYTPTGDADPSGSRFCTGTLTFHDQGNHGDWSGSFSIDVKAGSSTYTRTVSLS